MESIHGTIQRFPATLRTDSRDLRFLMQVGQGLGNKNDIYLIYTGDEEIYDVDLELSTTFQNFTGTTQRHLDAMAPPRQIHC